MEAYKECLAHRSTKSKGLCPRGYCTAKAKYKVYPSAYANGYASQVCNGTKPDYEDLRRSDLRRSDHRRSDNLRRRSSNLSRWYKEKWVNVCQRDNDGNYLPCSSPDAIDYPYCRPSRRLPGTKVRTVDDMTEAERSEMCKRKKLSRTGHVYVADLQLGGNPKFLPNMTLVSQYNKLKNKQKTAMYKGQQVTLYSPEVSDKKNKKLKVYVQDPVTGEIKRVDFGHTDYEDYTIHRDSSRRDSYCSRSGGIQCKGNECDVDSANYWSRMVLWNC
jgi:hypothetical protein